MICKSKESKRDLEIKDNEIDLQKKIESESDLQRQDSESDLQMLGSKG